MSRYEYKYKITRSYDELLKWVNYDVNKLFNSWILSDKGISTFEKELEYEERIKLLDEYIESEIKYWFKVLEDKPTLAEKRTELVYDRLKEDIIDLQKGQMIIDEFMSRKPNF